MNLTVPLATTRQLAGADHGPGSSPVAGFGPVDAQTARILAGAAARHPANRWYLSVIDDNGRVIGHGCRRQRTGPRPNLVIKLERLALSSCDHERETPAYQP